MFSGNVLHGFAKVADYFLSCEQGIWRTSFFVFFFFPVFNSFFFFFLYKCEYSLLLQTKQTEYFHFLTHKMMLSSPLILLVSLHWILSI